LIALDEKIPDSFDNLPFLRLFAAELESLQRQSLTLARQASSYEGTSPFDHFENIVEDLQNRLERIIEIRAAKAKSNLIFSIFFMFLLAILVVYFLDIYNLIDLSRFFH
jgi:uncharacterized protein YqhQ